MRSPFRSERQAFRLVPAVAAGAAAVAVTGAVAGAAVVAVVTVLVVAALVAFYLLQGRATRRIPAAPAHVGARGELRALLLVDEPPPEESLSSLGRQADRVLVVSLAETSPLRRWVSDVDPARKRANALMEDVVSRLRSLEVDVSGVVGEGDPFAAVDDALRTFGGDEIVVASHDARLVERLRDRYAIPVAPAVPT